MSGSKRMTLAQVIEQLRAETGGETYIEQDALDAMVGALTATEAEIVRLRQQVVTLATMNPQRALFVERVPHGIYDVRCTAQSCGQRYEQRVAFETNQYNVCGACGAPASFTRTGDMT